MLPLGPTFTEDPVFCGFEIQGTQDVAKVFVKALKTADGSMAFLATGAAKISLTANGKTITANVSGPVKEIDFPDGSATFLEKGLQPTALAPADAARFGLPGLFISAGALTITVDKDGNITSLSLDGHVLVDVCAALRSVRDFDRASSLPDLEISPRRAVAMLMPPILSRFCQGRLRQAAAVAWAPAA